MTAGVNTKYTWQGGNSYTSSSIGPNLGTLSTEAIAVDVYGNLFITCYNCAANNQGTYTVYEYTVGGSVITIQNGDSSGQQGPWGGGTFELFK